ncbi:uncharacterized protein E0L32_005048 [Thyridium curvatum]|uniref:RRM domain-containing protein n=1 Tax=Thyridium curvatum TaxID=1093900 RepID=A0A507BC12_9PEZI|nr:uncharacterized protein E0L32_005048 [Thyridium curvatum]TPX14939.1 hypothetical protein E0L32_005048 [Thyridium curvatum]
MYRSSTAPTPPRMSTAERQEMFRRLDEERRARGSPDGSPDGSPEHDEGAGGASLLHGGSDDQQRDPQQVVFTSQGPGVDETRKRKATSSLCGSLDGSAESTSSLRTQGHGRLASITRDFEPDNQPSSRLFTTGRRFSGTSAYEQQRPDDERHAESPEPLLDVSQKGYAKHRAENPPRQPDYRQSSNTFGDSEDLTNAVASSSKQENPYQQKLQTVPTGTVNNPRHRQHKKRAAESTLLTRDEQASVPVQFRTQDDKIHPIRQPSQPKFGAGEGNWRRKDDKPSAAAGIQGNWRFRPEAKTFGEDDKAAASSSRLNYGDSADKEADAGGRPSPETFSFLSPLPDSSDEEAAAGDRPSPKTFPLIPPIHDDSADEEAAAGGRPSPNPLFITNTRNAGPRRGLSGSRTIPDLGPAQEPYRASGPRPNPLFSRGPAQLPPTKSAPLNPTIPACAPRTPQTYAHAYERGSPMTSDDSLRRYAAANAAAAASPLQGRGAAGNMSHPDLLVMTDTHELVFASDPRASAGYRAPGPAGVGASGASRRTAIVGLGPADTDPFSSNAGGMVKSATIQELNPSLQPQQGSGSWDFRPLRSGKLNDLTKGPGGRPTFQQAMAPENFPFVESATMHVTSHPNRGVVKIVNVPFYVTRAEVIGYLGRNAGILNDNDEPVHIIMERTASKTNDVYVEFNYLSDAINAVNRNQRLIAAGRSARLGERPAAMELSSAASLMQNLFPHARGVHWGGGIPYRMEDNSPEPWNDFKGFITREEMTMLVKHVECPQRSPYARDCPQRPFEHMISVLKKLPWCQTTMITVAQRHAVYQSCVYLVSLLQNILHTRDDSRVNQMLLMRLVRAAMDCHGFTVLMKDSIAHLARLQEVELSKYCMPRFPESWRHAYSFAPKRNCELDVIEWYIAVIREETNRKVHNMSFLQRSRAQAALSDSDGYFGYFWMEVGYPDEAAFDNMTLAEVAIAEFGALENILSRALAGGHIRN